MLSQQQRQNRESIIIISFCYLPSRSIKKLNRRVVVEWWSFLGRSTRKRLSIQGTTHCFAATQLFMLNDASTNIAM
jgi:hypothetical protein